MYLKTLLNLVHPVKGFVYTKPTLFPDAHHPNGFRVEVAMRARTGSRGICSGCGQRGGTYDTQPVRYFDFPPLWGLAVVLAYAMRRINCPRCGVKVEQVPWIEPGSKSHMTLAYEGFLARWAKCLSWKQVADAFWVKWDTVYRAVESSVSYGLQHRELGSVTAVGIDEVAHGKGHNYLTLVYQLNGNCRRLLHVTQGRTARSLLGFFRMLKRSGVDARASIRYVCTDMWQPYLKVIAKKLPSALHILDRFHIVANANKAVDEIRAAEAKQLKAEGYEPVLHQTRWCLLKRKPNLTQKQRARLKDLLQYQLKTTRAYLKVQALHLLWNYTSPTWAGKHLDAWCRDVMRSRLEPLKKLARSLRKHRQLILNWFEAKKQYSSGIVEGMNANVKLGYKRAYGFRTFEAAQVALYHQLGQLPERPTTHRFY